MLYIWKGGREYLVAGSIDVPPTAEIASKMCGEPYDFLTFHVHFEPQPHRTQGIYRHGTAEGELNLAHQGKGHYTLFLQMKFRSFKDAQELYRRIRAGAIRPEISFEEEQVSSRPREIVVRCIHEYRGIRMNIRMWLKQLVTRIRQLVTRWKRLRPSWLPSH